MEEVDLEEVDLVQDVVEGDLQEAELPWVLLPTEGGLKRKPQKVQAK
jgi:hypothetical protein